MKIRVFLGIIYCFLSSNYLAFSQTFGIIGDYGWNPLPSDPTYQDDRSQTYIPSLNKMAVEAVADRVKSWNPDFIISVGDDSYWCRLSNNFDDNVGPFYRSYIFPYKGIYGTGSTTNKFYPVLGNHDYKTYIDGHGDCTRGGKNGETLWKEYFSKSSNYYDYVVGNVHFFAMNFNPEEKNGIDVNSVQAQWLKNKLASSTAQFKIVYGHMPIYVSCDPGSTHCSNPILQWPFQDWGADVVLSGDVHFYERNVVNGFTYIVNGIGGSKMDATTSTFLPETIKHYKDKWGAMRATVNSTENYIRFELYTYDNELIDDFLIRPNKAQQRSCK